MRKQDDKSLWYVILLCCALLCFPLGMYCGQAKKEPEIIVEIYPQSIGQTQMILKSLGFYHGEIDNMWGPQTEKAYCDYQASRYFTASGGKEK